MGIDGIILQLFEAFPHSKATEQTIAIYDRALGDIPPEELQVIVDQCIAECKFPPTVAEIRERHRKIVGGALAIETASEEWEKVKKAILRVGHWGTPEFDNPITSKVISSMGWHDICTSQNQVADRAHFMQMYNSNLERQENLDRLIPEARQLAEKRGGLKPIGEIMSLPDREASQDAD